MTVAELREALALVRPPQPNGREPAPYPVTLRIDGVDYDVYGVRDLPLGVELEVRPRSRAEW